MGKGHCGLLLRCLVFTGEKTQAYGLGRRTESQIFILLYISKAQVPQCVGKMHFFLMSLCNPYGILIMKKKNQPVYFDTSLEIHKAKIVAKYMRIQKQLQSWEKK